MSLIPAGSYRKTRGIIRAGLRADQPNANEVLEGTLYFVTDEDVIERSDGVIWGPFSASVVAPPFPQSDVTGLVAALASKLVSPVDLATQVSGVLPTANGGTSVNIASAGLPLGSGQIIFPASQNPSANVNTLDDYEEGTWTPAINFGGAAVGVTYSFQSGIYVKVGKLVLATGYIALSNKGSSAGVVTIAGLPFTSQAGSGANANSGSCSYGTGMAGLTSAPMFLMGSNATNMTLYQWGATGVSNLSNANFTNTSDLGFSMQYMANA